VPNLTDSKGNVPSIAQNSKSENKTKNDFFIALGHHDLGHYFYGKRSKSLIRMTTFGTHQFLMLAPKHFWTTHFPSERSAIDTLAATDYLIKQSLAVGSFNVSRVRGTGVWLDVGRVVLNTGEELLVNGETRAFESMDSRFHYIQTANRLPPIHKRSLTAKEGIALQKICDSFNWRNKKDAQLVAGWLMLARVAGALPIRPHIWITGGKGTGKSTVMEMLINPCLGDSEGRLFLQGASTEAGIRQSLGVSALPIMFDEFETTDDKASARRIASVIELLRSAWSQTSGRIRKGTPSGTALEYALNFAACLSSIRVKLDNDADESRVSVLELAPHGKNSQDSWGALLKNIEMVTETFGERLFSRACEKVPDILACYSVLSQALAALTSQRYGQQIGMLLAANWMLQHDVVITKAQASVVAANFVAGEELAEGLSDEEECLNWLLTWKLQIEGHDYMLGSLIKHGEKYRHEALNMFGVKIKGELFTVSNNHSELAKHFQSTRWAKHWSKALQRLPGAVMSDNSTYGSRKFKSRGISIPIANIED